MSLLNPRAFQHHDTILGYRDPVLEVQWPERTSSVVKRPVRDPQGKSKCLEAVLEISTNNTGRFEDVNEAGLDDNADRSEASFSKDLLSTWSCFLETFMELRKAQSVSSFSVFSVKPFHNVDLETSKSLIDFVRNYLKSDSLRTGVVEMKEKLFVKIRLRVLHGCNLLLSAIERDG